MNDKDAEVAVGRVRDRGPESDEFSFDVAENKEASPPCLDESTN